MLLVTAATSFPSCFASAAFASAFVGSSAAFGGSKADPKTSASTTSSATSAFNTFASVANSAGSFRPSAKVVATQTSNFVKVVRLKAFTA